MNTSNGVERKNKDFKYEILKQFKDKSLSGLNCSGSSRDVQPVNIKPFYLPSESSEKIPLAFT